MAILPNLAFDDERRRILAEDDYRRKPPFVLNDVFLNVSFPNQAFISPTLCINLTLSFSLSLSLSLTLWSLGFGLKFVAAIS